MGVRHLARRAAGFAEDNMHAEVVNGMDVLAVRDAVRRAVALCRAGEGPGADRGQHLSLLRPLTLRSAQRVPDPRRGVGLAGGGPDRAAEAPARGGRRGGRGRASRRWRHASGSATRAPRSASQPRRIPDPADVLRFLYTDTSADEVPASASSVAIHAEPPVAKRDAARHDHLQGRPARGPRGGDDARRPGAPLRRGRGGVRRRLQAHQGPARDVRAGARLQHADLRSLHLRHRRGGGDRRPAPGRRAHVHGLRADGVGPDCQPGGEVALHERRPGGGAAGHPGVRRGGQGLRRPAQPEPREHLHARPGDVGGLPGHAGGRKGHAEVRDPDEQPGDVRREPGPLPVQGRRARGRHPRPDRQRQDRARRDRTRRWSPGGPLSSMRWPPPRRWRRSTGSRPRSSTCGASCRSTWRRSWRRYARPVAASWRARRSSSAAT